MKWNLRRGSTTTIIALAVVLLAGTALALSGTHVGTISGTGVIAAPDGPSATVSFPSGTQINLQENTTVPDANTLHLNTSVADATFSSNGPTSFDTNVKWFDDSATELQSLSLNGNTLDITAGSKPATSISGSFGTVAVYDYGPKDTEIDFVYTQSGDVTFYNLSADTGYKLVNFDTGEAVDTATSDASGTVTFNAPDTTGGTDSVYIQKQATSAEIPTLSNPAPTGPQETAPNQLAITVGHSDFANESVTVDIYFEGSKLKTTTINSKTRVTAALPAGSVKAGPNDWSVTATDTSGDVVSDNYAFSLNSTLYIRPETQPNDLVTNTSSVQIIELTADNAKNVTVVDRTVNDGTINISGLSVEPDYITVVNPEGYYGRSVILSSLTAQQDIFVLNKTKASVESRFKLDDVTGQFPTNSRVIVSRPINQTGEPTKYETIHSDVFGAEGVTVDLLEGQRYRVTVVAPDGTRQVIGPYRADVGETVTVQPGVPDIPIGEYKEGWAANAELHNRTLEWRYSDPDVTDSLTVRIYERGNESNELVPPMTYTDVTNVSQIITLTENESKKAWTAEFEITRDGETFTVTEHTRNRPDLLPYALDDGIKIIIAGAILLLTGGLFSVRNVAVGGIATSLVAGLLWWLGFLPGVTTGAAITIALTVSVLYKTMKRGGP